MGVLGIIAEYNPFHNGHLYHLIESKKISHSDYTIAIISGNFVQRGNTSIVDKWTKAEMALLGGVDLVLELPTIYSISSAENFADGAIKILNSLQIVDSISFGSESGDINLLETIADVFYSEPKEYVSLLNHELSKGISYPKARENAALMYLKDIRKYANILSSPNNILAIEYLKSLKKYKSNITPFTIKRNKIGYNDENVVDGFSSSTAIRKMIQKSNISIIKDVVPSKIYELLNDKIKKGNFVLDLSSFEKEIIYNFRKLSISEIKELPDVGEGLENSIKSAANMCNNLVELVNIVKSKRYTQTRIQRILLYCLLEITKKDMLLSYKTQPYVRVLGMNSNGKQLLSEITKFNKKINLVTSVKDFMNNCNNKDLKRLLGIDILATNIYTLGYYSDSYSNLDYTNKIEII